MNMRSSDLGWYIPCFCYAMQQHNSTQRGIYVYIFIYIYIYIYIHTHARTQIYIRSSDAEFVSSYLVLLHNAPA